MDKTSRIDFTIKTESSDEVVVEKFGRTTEPIGLMMALQQFVHQDTREESNA